MTDFSINIKNVLLSVGGGYPKILEDAQQKFLEGDRSALMTALIACSLWQKVIPDWVADELLTLDSKIADCQIKDMNEFFSFKSEHGGKLGAYRKIAQNEQNVVNALFHHRANGGNFTTDDGIEEVAQKLGLSRRTVQEIYNKNKVWLKKMPLKNKQNSGYMLGDFSSLLELAQRIRQSQEQ
jgi:hypothetical protein